MMMTAKLRDLGSSSLNVTSDRFKSDRCLSVLAAVERPIQDSIEICTKRSYVLKDVL